MFRRLAGLALVAMIGAAALGQPQNYAQRGVNIRAGIVLLESSLTAGTPTNSTPFVWFNLDSNRNAKPAGWNIYNPNAPGQASQAIVNRWTSLAGVVGGGAPALYERITKRNAAYWEIRPSFMTDAQLASYDVLLVNATGNVALNSLERERLRNFVDRGGVLWIEVAGINNGNFDTLNTINNFPLPFTVAPGANGPGTLDAFHPVLSYPYTFNITNLGYLNGSTNLTFQQAAPAAGAGMLSPWISTDWLKLKPVVLANNQATLMVGRIGDGFVVLTSRNAAGFLNQINNGGGYAANNQYYALDPRGGLDKGSDTIGKLVVNMISLGSSSEQPGNGTRKSNSTPIDVGAPLLKRFDSQVNGLDFGQKNSFPTAAYKGLAVVVSNAQILVFDANPKSDLDGDGNPDDGIQDYALGNNLDLVWQSQPLAGPISAATCVEVAQPAAGVPTDQIMVTTADGTVAAYNAFPTNPAGQIVGGSYAPSYTVAPPTIVTSVATNVIGHGPYAPTYHEGLAFVATNPGTPTTGSVWVFDPAQGTAMFTGGQRWLVGDTSAPTIQEISAPPTVGYIPIADNSGGLDRVAYVPSRPGSGLPGPNAGIYSLWIGTRGESPTTPPVVNGGNLTVITRATQRGLWLNNSGGSLGIKLTVIKPTGDPIDIAEFNNRFTGTVVQSSPGVLDFQLGAGGWDPTYTVRLDYTIDWGRGPAASAAIVRGSIFLPDDPNNRRPIVGNIAMTGRGTIYVVHSSTVETSSQRGGALYGFREQGQGAFNCVMRYDVYGPHTINLNQSSPAQIPGTVTDNDQLLNLVPFLAGSTSNMTLMTGPVVKGDYVYAAAMLRKSGAGFVGFVPFTTLLAFKSEPEAPEIQIGDLSDGFQLLQPDLIRSASKTNPTTLTVGVPGQYQYLRESGKIRFNSLMSPNRGQISGAFSLSQPVILRSGGRPDRLVYPDALAGSRWSPLTWFTVMHGFDMPTTPVVTGDTVIIGGASYLPLLVLGIPPGPGTVVGMLYGLNADISESDPFTVTDNNRPWLRQVHVLQDNGGGNIKANTNIRWPQNEGITSFEVWGLRVIQASMPNTRRTMSVAAGEGALFATAGDLNGVYGDPGYVFGFSKADFYICDEGRFGRYDTAGNPIFATDISGNSGTETNAGSATSVRPIQRPTRAYPVGATDTVIVDPGSNRVVRLDGAGRELRSIENFKLDPASGIALQANETLTLNNPRDVTVFSEFVQNPANVSNPQATEFWVHYVIADTGNRRILDLIDRYYVGANRVVGDVIQLPSGERQLGVLRWHSPPEFSGKRFEYSSITRSANLNNPAQYWYIAGIGSATPTRVDVGLDTPGGTLPRESNDGNGGVVILSPFNPAQNEVFNEITIPAIGANVYLDRATGNYDPNPRNATVKKLANLTSVSVRNVQTAGGPLWAIMVTDATGVYEVSRPGGAGTPWIVRWMMPKEAYRVLRNRPGAPATIFGTNPLEFRPNYARRLDSGEVLIVNGYVGKLFGGADFAGEVIQVDGDDFATTGTGFGFNRPNFGFYFGSMRFEISTLSGTRSMYQPVFADRR